MSARELAMWMGRGDAWISAILIGRQGLQLRDLDRFAAGLKWPVSELVREDNSELRELTPTEMEIIRIVRDWPAPVKNHWVALLRHFSANESDRLVSALKALMSGKTQAERGVIVRFLELWLQSGTPPRFSAPESAPQTDGEAHDTTAEPPPHRGSRKPAHRR